MIFIKFLKDKGIDKIEIPRLYILDYNYHAKSDNVLRIDVEERKKVNEELTDFYDEFYEERVGKSDIISKAKSEDLARIAVKAKDYIPDIEILDLDNRILLDISMISLDNIDNELVEYFHSEIDRNKSKLEKDAHAYRKGFVYAS